jgi:hypothetical protein
MRFEYDILSAHWRTSLWQPQEGGRWAQATINLGSGGHSAALDWRRRRNAHTVGLLGQEGGGKHAAVMVGQQWDVSGGEG